MTAQELRKATENLDQTTSTGLVLCVDDEIYNLEILEKYLEHSGYKSVLAKNGTEALQKLAENKGKISAVLLDRMMPDIDGIEVLKRMKQEEIYKHIPVIMQTAAAESHEIAEGIRSGAYYYLTKPYSEEILMAIVRSAILEHEEKRKSLYKIETANEVSKYVQEMSIEYNTISEAYAIANYIAYVFCNNDSNILVSLSELMLNAVEHGNLGINHDLKAELILENNLEAEIKKRIKENRDKKVAIKIGRRQDDLVINIKDQGSGFNWQEYIDFDPIRMTNPSGRGLAIAHTMSPDSISFIGKGNEVEVVYRERERGGV